MRFIRKSNVVKEIKDYNKEKVLVRQLGENINSTFDFEGHITTQSVYCIASDDFSTKVLTSILNSSIVNFIYQNYFKEKKEFPRILLENIKELPLPKKKEKTFKLIERNVEKILNNKKILNKDTSILEQEIDNLVYRLYELTYDEVKVIDPQFSLTEDEYKGFLKGNILKYQLRLGKKDNVDKEIIKIKDYQAELNNILSQGNLNEN